MADPTTKTEDEKGVHRLFSMDTQEVSVVDRAANKHRFLLVKNADGSKSEVPIEETKKVEAVASPAPPAPVAKSVVSPLERALESCQELRHQVEAAPVSDSATPIPRNLALCLRELQLSLKKFSESKHKSGSGDHGFYGVYANSSTSLAPLGAEAKKDILATLSAIEGHLTKLKGSYDGKALLAPEESKGVADHADKLGDVLAKHPHEASMFKSARSIVEKSLDPEARSRVLDVVEKSIGDLLDLSGSLRTPGVGVAEAHVADQFEVGSRLTATAEMIKQAFAGKASVEASVTELSKTTTTPAPAAAAGTTEVGKVGRPMNGDRLGRLKSLHALFKGAISELKGGTVPLEKFDAVASGLKAIVDECDVTKFLKKRASDTKKMIGAADLRSTTALNPNVGAGVQKDLATVASADAVFGEGVPGEVGQIMKQFRDELQKRDAVIQSLRGDVVNLKKFRAAPTYAEEAQEEEVLLEKGETFDADESVVWAPDMAAERIADLDDDED